MTLHEAIRLVLNQSKSPMTPQEIANEINHQQLYTRSDNNPVPGSQISARINKYPELFIKNNDGTVSAKSDRVSDLLNLATQLQNKLRNIWAHGMVSPFVFQLLVPLFFFYKRTLDYKPILKYFNWKTLEKDYNLKGLTSLAQHLDNNFEPLKSKLYSLVNDLQKLSNNESFTSTFNCLKDEDLSLLNAKDFGRFFNALIYKTNNHIRASGQLAIPETLAELFVGMCKPLLKKNIRIYNPASGLCTIPALISQNSQIPFNFSGEEIFVEIYIFSLLNLMANDINIDQYFNDDSLQYSQIDKNDIIICVPPLGGQYDKLTNNFPIVTKEINLLFIQHCLLHLNEEGIAFVVVPERVLFDSGKPFENLRKYLIDNGFLKAVISLPVGILFPLSGIKTSMLVLSKSNRQVKFIDAAQPSFYSKTGRGIIELDVPLICNEYFDLVDNVLFEPITPYGQRNSVLLEPEKIKSDKYNLTVSRHLLAEDKDPAKRTLKEVLHLVKGEKSQQKLKYVNISDLNANYQSIYLDKEGLGLIKDHQTGKIIKGSLLLIGSIPPNIKPTFYTENEAIIISPNVYAFRVDTSLVKIEYLIYELCKEYIKKQLMAIAVGVTSLRRFSTEEFLTVKINIPSLEEQAKIIEIHKEALTSRIFPDVTSSKGLAVTGKTEKEILGFVKHEIGNISGGINSDIQNLTGFLKRKTIDLSEPISERKNAVPVKDVLLRMNNNLSDIGDLLENIQNIIDFGESNTTKECLSFRNFINNELLKYDNYFNSINIKTFIGVSEEYEGAIDCEVLLDPAQFALVIRNFIINCIKHGFAAAELEKIIVINIKEDTDFYYLSLINTGLPFPEDFTINDFRSFGIRYNTSKGSGLGGYLMSKVIENHEGKIELIKEGSEFPISAFHSIIWVNPTVHFLITLPKSI